METYAAANPPASECCAPAPPVLEFDEEGNLIGHWGGPGQGYDWPESNHGITVDYKGNVWIGGNGRPAPSKAVAGGPAPARRRNPAPGYYNDNMILKFTQDGKFLMQIGKPGQSKGSNDIDNLKGPAKMFVDPKTNELYVADGYGNHRVIVFDAEPANTNGTGAPTATSPTTPTWAATTRMTRRRNSSAIPCTARSFRNDGLLYVCDRPNDRIQVFKPDGTFLKEIFSTRTRWATDRSGISPSRRIRSRSTSTWPTARTRRSHILDREIDAGADQLRRWRTAARRILRGA